MAAGTVLLPASTASAACGSAVGSLPSRGLRLKRFIIPMFPPSLVTLLAALPPPPPMVTPNQRASIARLASAARAQSASPQTAAVLAALLADGRFRAELAPALRGLPPGTLLQRYRAELQVAEIAHGFPARNDPSQNNALDLDIAMASEAEWFYNQWQLPVLFPRRERAAQWELISYLAPAAAAEVGLWGLRPFSAPVPLDAVWPGGFPANLSEASDRMVYNVANLHRLDFPSYLWGDVAVVFNNSDVLPHTLFMPMDSGDYTCICDRGFTRPFCGHWPNASACGEFWYCSWDAAGRECRDIGAAAAGAYVDTRNCSDWPGHAVGRADAADHTLATFAYWYNRTDAPARVARLFNRLLLPWRLSRNMSTTQFDYYYEANVLANIPLVQREGVGPRGSVRFVLAYFLTLWGTAQGAAVRRWCANRGWVLLWALGPNYARDGTQPPDPPHSWGAKARVADPHSLRAAGIEAPTAAQAAARVWRAVAAVRAVHPGGRLPPATSLAAWRNLSAALPPSMHLEPVRSGACAPRPHDCVGIGSDGTCLCYKP